MTGLVLYLGIISQEEVQVRGNARRGGVNNAIMPFEGHYPAYTMVTYEINKY